MNNIKKEIHRIHEIMGVNKQLLTEAINPFTEFFEFLFKQADNKLAKEVETLLLKDRGLRQQGIKTVDDLIKNIDKNVVRNALSRTVFLDERIVSLVADSFLKKNPDVKNKIASILLKATEKNEPEAIAGIKEIFKSLEVRDENFINALINVGKKDRESYLQTAETFLKDKNSLKIKLKGILENAENKEEAINQIKNILERENNIKSENVREAIIKILEKETSLNSKVIAQVVSQFEPSDIESIRRMWARMFKSKQKLQKEFIDTYNLAEKAISKGEDPQFFFKKMADILASTKKNFKQTPEILYYGNEELGIKGWRSLLPKKTVEMLEKDESGFMKVFNELVKKRTLVDPWKVEGEAFKKAWPFRLPYSKNKQPGWFIFKGSADSWKRLARFIAWQDPRTFSEIKNAIYARGIKGSLAATVIGRLMLHGLVTPALIATMQTSSRMAISFFESFINYVLQITGNKKVNFVNYWEDKDKPFYISDWWESYKKSLPKDVWEFLNPTEIQTVYNFIVEPIGKGGKTVFTDEEAKELSKKSEGEIKKFLNENPDVKEKIGWDDNKTTEENIKNLVKNTPVNPNPTIENFYEYISNLPEYKGKIGKLDLPYMKQDQNNPNLFTFEACVDPPSCTSTQTRKFIYNPTNKTFSEQN